MSSGHEIVNYYSILHVDTDCSPRELELAYHYFTKMYHPDNAVSANVDKFTEVVEAYKVLRDPDARAEYDRLNLSSHEHSSFKIPLDHAAGIDEATALKDAEIHARILLQLYKQRREHSSDSGVAGWLLQETLECSEDHFEFHVWYLKSKGFIDFTEDGTWAVTVQGVDHVISMSRTKQSEKLLLSKSNPSEE